MHNDEGAMPQAKRGVVEIRMDRRQAFYVVVGSLLIVSVAFVVGLIVGQRMQILEVGGDDAAGPGLSATAPREAPNANGSEAVAAAEPDDYTFYDELRAQPPRPLLLPSPGGIGEPAEAIRRLDRNPSAQPDDAPTDAPAPEPEPPAAEPAPEPEPEPPAAERASEPVAAPVEPAPERIALAPAPDEPTARRITRRVVRAQNEPTAPAAADESGYFTVEAGLFPSFSTATELRNRLRSAGHDAIVTIVAPTAGERQYRVQVGSYTRRSEANDIASQIVDLGLPASVVREG